jgi:hemerythrin-like domain-containing protein
MKATDILMEEHRLIERFINALEAASSQLEHGRDIRPGLFMEAADFIESFAEGCHNRKEEDVLFQVMAESGFPIQSGPIAVMLHEHTQGRAHQDGLRAAAVKLSEGDSSAREAVIEHAREYASVLQQHIMKEDQVLFPMANQAIPLSLYAEIDEGFEWIEREVGLEHHPRAWLEQFEKEIMTR